MNNQPLHNNIIHLYCSFDSLSCAMRNCTTYYTVDFEHWLLVGDVRPMFTTNIM